MKMRVISGALFLVGLVALGAAAVPVENYVVFREEGRFAGWPANNGIWSWGDEIVVGFTLGYHKDNLGGHDIDPDRPSEPRQARSLDGGETWSIETPSYLEEDGGEMAPRELRENVDFSHPDFAARFRNNRFYYSLDRCHTWHGPFLLPDFGRKGLLARTDYIVDGKHELTAFIAAEKDRGGEGQPACIRTKDGGKTWELVGWIGEQPPAGYGYSIMPSTIRLGDGGYLSMIRRAGVRDGEKRWWLEAYVSPDRGQSWYLLEEPRIENGGNPASMIRLEDGRIALTYGWRRLLYGIRARLSDDNGQTWGPEIVLRKDGASWDLGYPRTVQREDGKCVTIYYFHDRKRPERYIGCTIWEPRWNAVFASWIYEAWRQGKAMPQLSTVYPEPTLERGYDVQRWFVKQIMENDETGGYKAAIVGAEGQDNLGLDAPLTGVVPASGVLSAADKIAIDLDDFPNRHIETEIGYIFSKPVSELLADEAALRQHVGSVAPVVEVPGGATQDRSPATAADLVAWNINGHSIIVGDGHDPAEIDVDNVNIELTHNSDTINEARGGQAAGGQWNTLLKAVNNVVRRGYEIRAGHVLTNGAVGKIVKAEPGEYKAEYGELGTITFEVK